MLAPAQFDLPPALAYVQIERVNVEVPNADVGNLSEDHPIRRRHPVTSAVGR